MVRIKKAPVSEDGTKILSIHTPGFETKKKKEDYGIWELPPDYKTGAYNSDLCSARQTEIDLATQRRERKRVETKDEVLNKLQPIYLGILQAKKDEEEIMKLPQKLRDKERKSRQSIRETSSKGRLSLPNNSEGLSIQASQNQKDGQKPTGDPGIEDASKAQPLAPINSISNLSGLKLPLADQDGKLTNQVGSLNHIPGSLRDLPGGGTKSYIGMSKKEIEDVQIKEDESIYQIIDTVFDYNPNLEFLNLKFFSKYTEEKGAFKFIIDGLHNLPKTGFYVTSYTLNPEAVYYIEDKKEDISVYTNFDWNRSTKKSIFYNEGYIKFKGKPFKTNLHFLIELARIDLPAFTDPQIKPVAWTLLPVFVVDPLSKQGYVNSNIYQLPLFEGPISKDRALELQNCEDPWETAMAMMKAGKIKYWSSASVYCRLLDVQREGHFQKSFDFERASEEYLPEKKLSNYRFYKNDEVKIEKKKVSFLKDTIPYQEDPYNFNKRITEVCCAQYGITVEK